MDVHKAILTTGNYWEIFPTNLEGVCVDAHKTILSGGRNLEGVCLDFQKTLLAEGDFGNLDFREAILGGGNYGGMF